MIDHTKTATQSNIMKQLCLLIISGALMMIFTGDMYAQSLSYEMDVDSRSYQMIAERAGESGITPAEFGRWLSENATVSETVDWTDQDGSWSNTGKLTILAVDQRGTTIGTHTIQMNMTQRPAPLGRMVNAAELGRAIDQEVNMDFIKPDPDFLNPVNYPAPDHWAPDNYPAPDLWDREVQGAAVNDASRTLGRMDDADAIAIVLMVTPDANELFDAASPGLFVEPAGFVFCSMGRH